jgi:hypothetical protein
MKPNNREMSESIVLDDGSFNTMFYTSSRAVWLRNSTGLDLL